MSNQKLNFIVFLRYGCQVEGTCNAVTLEQAVAEAGLEAKVEKKQLKGSRGQVVEVVTVTCDIETSHKIAELPNVESVHPRILVVRNENGR